MFQNFKIVKLSIYYINLRVVYKLFEKVQKIYKAYYPLTLFIVVISTFVF